MPKFLLGAELRKVQPKLRMVSNGTTVVNAIRAEAAPSVAVRSERILGPQRDG
jgi:hypothetical protein